MKGDLNFSFSCYLFYLIFIFVLLNFREDFLRLFTRLCKDVIQKTSFVFVFNGHLTFLAAFFAHFAVFAIDICLLIFNVFFLTPSFNKIFVIRANLIEIIFNKLVIWGFLDKSLIRLSQHQKSFLYENNAIDVKQDLFGGFQHFETLF